MGKSSGSDGMDCVSCDERLAGVAQFGHCRAAFEPPSEDPNGQHLSPHWSHRRRRDRRTRLAFPDPYSLFHRYPLIVMYVFSPDRSRRLQCGDHRGLPRRISFQLGGGPQLERRYPLRRSVSSLYFFFFFLCTISTTLEKKNYAITM